MSDVSVSLDLAPLLREPDTDDIARLRAAGPSRTSASRRVGLLLNTAAASLSGGAFAFAFIWLVDWTVRQLFLTPSLTLLWALVPLAFCGWAGYRLLLLARRWIGYLYLPWRHWAKLSAFAHENGLAFVPRSEGTTHLANLFMRGRDALTSDRIIWPDNAMEIGVHQYTDFDQVTKRYRDWQYLVVRIDRRLPHMVLHARANRRAGNLPGGFQRDQTLSLEGQFDRHFTLYAPVTHRSDALYIFTPDLMSVLMTHATAFDVEIIDDRVVFCSPAKVNLASPVAIGGLLALARSVVPKTRSRAVRYRDDRAGGFVANVVAESGARLRQTAVATGSLGGGLLFGSLQLSRLTTQGTLPVGFAIALLAVAAIVGLAAIGAFALAPRMARALLSVRVGTVRLWSAGALVAAAVAAITATTLLSR